MNRALLDTDVFSEFLKGHDPKVGQNAADYRQEFGPLSISVVTVMEIIKGLHKMRREMEIQTFLSRLSAAEVLGFDIASAQLAGRIHADLERSGQPIGWADTVIAAIPLQHRLDLVTGNTSHYERIQQIGHPLVLINWRL